MHQRRTESGLSGASWFRKLGACLKQGWRMHCELLATNPVYRTVLVVLTDLVLRQLDVSDLVQTLIHLIGGALGDH